MTSSTECALELSGVRFETTVYGVALSRLSREREDLYPVRDLSHAVGLDLSAPFTGAVQWTDLAAVQAQLQNQRQTIESLTQNLRSVARERDAQQRQIQALQEEVKRLRERLEDQAKERVMKQDIEVPAVEMRIEQWKREVGRELSALRGHIDRTTSLGNREERLAVSGLKDEVKGLILKDRLSTAAEVLSKSSALEVPVAVETSPRRRLLSDSDDELSPTPSLGDVSSDDLDTSWLGDSARKLRRHEWVARLSGSDLSDTASGLGDSHERVGETSDSSPDLSLSDL
ncbi:hypothetical protein Baya_9409 [Bagarius yarrelli]|uniref:Uncharacterized protein n=1 Tax=Bagarius yarrelli TaxID=175774 RepID=A0A556U6L5_BAGYA|nr:hypothetical protein Baya_9409 [Bagarius yarrelli]